MVILVRGSEERKKKKKKRGMREDENDVRDFWVSLWPVTYRGEREMLHHLCGPK